MNRVCNEPGCTNLTEKTDKWYRKKCHQHRRNTEQDNKQRVNTHKQNKAIVYTHYGSICECCGEKEPMFLTVDHINNDGNIHRKQVKSKLYGWLIRNNFPDTFRILCFNCNTGRAINGGICPHQQND